jgi:hypothetical protein
MFVQASFVKKIKPDSNGLTLYGIGVPVIVLAVILSAAGASDESMRMLGSVMQLGAGILILVGHFSLRRSLEDYYNSVEPLNLQLSGVMTFFFNVIYFQYHLNWIRQYKVTGVRTR